MPPGRPVTAVRRVSRYCLIIRVICGLLRVVTLRKKARMIPRCFLPCRNYSCSIKAAFTHA